jgi:hypothetical protein
MKTFEEQYPILYKEAVAMSNVILKSINDKASKLPDEGCYYKTQGLLESVIAELEKAV